VRLYDHRDQDWGDPDEFHKALKSDPFADRFYTWLAWLYAVAFMALVVCVMVA